MPHFLSTPNQEYKKPNRKHNYLQIWKFLDHPDVTSCPKTGSDIPVWNGKITKGSHTANWYVVLLGHFAEQDCRSGGLIHHSWSSTLNVLMASE